MSLGRCHFLPPYLLRQIVDAADLGVDAPPEAIGAARESLLVDEQIRAQRAAAPEIAHPLAAGAAWTVYTAGNATSLPGTRVRGAEDPASGDDAVDEAAVGGAGALALFAEVYGRESFDDAGAEVLLTVHYGRNYDNAFWNGTQLVFGDGDGRVFERFTKPVDVLGHELTHAVTEHTAGLVYRDQPGALNESISDVFASCAKQRMLGQDVTRADWLIGAGLFRPGINARGLRDMAAPGTAYDDPVLGWDPQVGHMSDFIDTTDDSGGVHLNSGISNRAFFLAATGIGGTSWEGAGAIWYAALTGSDVGPTTGFAGFAAATIAVAGDHADVVAQAWAAVGVTSGVPTDPPPADGPSSESSVEVRRSGGFVGRSMTGSVDLSVTTARVGRVRELVGRADLASARPVEPHPDMYTYTFCLPGCAAVEVPEQHLTDDLRELAALVLEGETDA